MYLIHSQQNRKYMTYYVIPGLKRNLYEYVKKTQPNNYIYAKEIIEKVSKFYGIELNEVYSKNRDRDVVKVCQVSTFLIYDRMPNMGLKKVAELFGNRYLGKTGFDHSAIIYNRKCMQDLIDSKDYIVDDLLIIQNLI